MKKSVIISEKYSTDSNQVVLQNKNSINNHFSARYPYNHARIGHLHIFQFTSSGNFQHQRFKETKEQRVKRPRGRRIFGMCKFSFRRHLNCVLLNVTTISKLALNLNLQLSRRQENELSSVRVKHSLFAILLLCRFM